MHFSYFDYNHYSKVRFVREQENRPHIQHHRESSDMSLLGKTVVETSTGKSYKVDKVVEHWFMGWYRVITMVDAQGSHAVRWVENISSHSSDVAEAIEKFKIDCKVVN